MLLCILWWRENTRSNRGTYLYLTHKRSRVLVLTTAPWKLRPSSGHLEESTKTCGRSSHEWDRQYQFKWMKHSYHICACFVIIVLWWTVRIQVSCPSCCSQSHRWGDEAACPCSAASPVYVTQAPTCHSVHEGPHGSALSHPPETGGRCVWTCS